MVEDCQWEGKKVEGEKNGVSEEWAKGGGIFGEKAVFLGGGRKSSTLGLTQSTGEGQKAPRQAGNTSSQIIHLSDG